MAETKARPQLVPVPPAAAPRPAASIQRRLLRPLARVERISLFEREVKERLSRAALDVVFAAAALMSEGQRAARGNREVFHGSTMLTIELEAVAGVLRDAGDARAAQRLAALLASDASAHARIKRLATGEVERLCAARPRAVNADVKVRARGTTVYVDVDVEASF